MKKIQFNSIYALLLALLVFSAGCKKDEGSPLLLTQEAKNIGSAIAYSGGNVEWEDASAVSGRGICWSTHINPTIEDKKTSNGKGTGSFESALTGLSPHTSYYIRAYVIKDGRVIYGNEVSFATGEVVTDIDGNNYNTITIGNQVWMAENLRTTRFSNGELIGTTTPANLNIMYAIDPVYQWAYNGMEKNAVKYGRLYTWYAAQDPRRLAPTGWHIPSDEEWTELEEYLTSHNYNYDGSNTGNKLALALATAVGWSHSETSGTPGDTTYANSRNKIGFTAIPAGYRDQEGQFTDVGNASCWWSSSEAFTYNAYYRYIRSTRKDLLRSSFFEFGAVSVRCIKDK